MSLIGCFTNIGLDKTRSAQNNTGFKIFVTGFAVSDVATSGGIPALQALTAANGGVWFSGVVSSYSVISTNIVQVILSVPPSVGSVQKDIKEIYVYGKDVDNNDFLLAVGQPEDTLLYDPTGQTTLRLQLKLTNADVSSLFQFLYTQATEISEHNQDPNAHPVIQNQIRKAGIFDAPADHEFIGQHFDEFATFGVGVTDQKLVYQDADGSYKLALADGTNKSLAVGVSDLVRDQVYVNGIVQINHGYPEGTQLFLSDSVAGTVTDSNTGYPIGVAKDELHVFLRIQTPKLDVIGFINTVVSDEPGLNHYPDPQDAIDACPSNGWVRFDKLAELHGPNPLTTNGKIINFLFTGIGSGLKTFAGVNEIQKIDFGAIPTSGDFVLEHDGNKTSRLAFNASAAAIEAALEALPSITSVTVTGSFGSGFTIEFTGVDGLLNQLQIAPGTYAGNNEIQQLDFSSDDIAGGSFRLEFNSQQTNSIAFNSVNASTIQAELLALSTIDTVIVTEDLAPPSGTKRFTVEFSGSVDGLKPQNALTVPQNTLSDSSSDPISVTVSEPTPGVFPDNLLKIGVTPVSIAGTTIQQGEPPGGLTAFSLDTPGCQFIGLGRLQDFSLGIDANAQPVTRIEMYFDNVAQPVDATGLSLNEINADGSIGFSFNDPLPDETLFRNLVKVNPSPTPNKTVLITSAEVTLNDGSKHGLVIDDHVSAYPGGSANFQNGTVVGGGANFVPYTALTSGNYFKYAVILKLDDTISIIPPTGESNNPNTAPLPPITDGLLRAIVTVKDDGAGGIENITSTSIKRFFDTGAFIKKRQQKRFIAPGGSAIFDVAPEFTFDPDNAIQDIDVYINGTLQTQDLDGNLTQDYRKISDTEIEFSYTVPADALVTIDYKTTRIDSLSTGIVQANFKSQTIVTDGIATTLTFSDLNWSTDNSVEDLEVFQNGAEQELDKDGSLTADFHKVANNQIQFLMGGVPWAVPAGAKIRAKVRLFALGSSSAVNTIAGQDEGSEVVPIVGTLDVRGPAAQVTQPSPGIMRVQIDGEPNDGQNVGVGPGQIYAGKSGFDILMRSIRGATGITVYVDGNEIVVALATSAYYRNYQTNIASPVMPVGAAYDIGSRRLQVHRNGIRMTNSMSYGGLIDRYIENSVNTIQLLEAALLSDVFTFTNIGLAPVFLDIQGGLSGTTITLPAAITLGDKRLLVFRNGVLMNNAGLGGPVDRYTETSTTQITLDQAAVPSDVFILEYAGAAYDFREDVSPFVGSTLNLSNSLNPGDNKELVFKNGVLLYNSNTLGVADDRYGIADATTINLGAPANLLDYFTVINQA